MRRRWVGSVPLSLAVILAVALMSRPQGGRALLLSDSAAFCIPTTGTITDRFRPGHQGVDISSGPVPGIAPVFAAYAGRVVYRGTMNLGSSLDVAVAINHGLVNGVYVLTQYHHMGHDGTSYVVVNVGDWVQQGQLIGFQGDYPPAYATGVHLHFGVGELDVPFLDAYTSWGDRCVREDLWYEFGGADCPVPNPSPATNVDPERDSYLGPLPGSVTATCPNPCCCSSYATSGGSCAVEEDDGEDVSTVWPEAHEVLTPSVVVSGTRTLPVQPGAPFPTPEQLGREVVDPQRAPPASTHYRIPKGVFAVGGGPRSSTRYRMNGTQGQSTDLSRRQSTSYVLVPGYWSRPISAADRPSVYLPLVMKKH